MKTIAVVGVDGTGKSTIIRELKEALGNDVVCIYMGCRDYEFKSIQYFSKRNSNIALAINTVLIYLCFWFRYFKGILSRRIVIFDRYVHEIYINAPLNYGKVLRFVYRWLFPQPSLIIYLHCPVEVSLSRKDDIENPELFRSMKKKFDGVFMSNPKVIKYDTSKLSVEDITKSAQKEIWKKWKKKL